MDFEFLDDSFSCVTWHSLNLLYEGNSIVETAPCYNDFGDLEPYAKQYTKISKNILDNHPLYAIVSCFICFIFTFSTNS